MHHVQGRSRVRRLGFFVGETPRKIKCEGQLAVRFLDKPHNVVKADSGGIRFRLSSSLVRRQHFCFRMLKKECIHEEIYTVSLGENSCLYGESLKERICFKIPDYYQQPTYDFWLTWYNDTICFGQWNEPPLLIYPEETTNNDKEIIGFIKFELSSENGTFVDCEVESMPIMAPITVLKPVSGGELRWVRMTSTSTLPIDALIGGLENEPLYVARARHRGSLCPGKYVKSKQLAYIPWCQEEIPKEEFEILCGYDAIWIKSSGRSIPENAFVGGHSEIRNEPLFIGRAWVRNNLIVGKVHVMLKSCFLPFRQREVERGDFETLVSANKLCRGHQKDLPCHMKMCRQICL